MLFVFAYIKFNILELLQNCQVRSVHYYLPKFSQWSLWRNFLVCEITFFVLWIFRFHILHSSRELQISKKFKPSKSQSFNFPLKLLRRNELGVITESSTAIPLEKVNIDLSISRANCLWQQINCIETDFEQYFLFWFALYSFRNKNFRFDK